MNWNEVRGRLFIAGIAVLLVAVPVCFAGYSHFIGLYIRSPHVWADRITNETFMRAGKWFVSGLVCDFIAFMLVMFGRGWRRTVSLIASVVMGIFLAGS